MSLKSLALSYQEIFRKKFPQVHVIKDPEVGDLDDGVLAIMCLPDNAVKAYYDFVYNELGDILEARGIERVTLIPHTDSDLQTYYPEYYNQFHGWPTGALGETTCSVIVSCSTAYEEKAFSGSTEVNSTSDVSDNTSSYPSRFAA